MLRNESIVMDKNQRGFSLIELMIVLVIIGFMFYFLMTVLQPNLIFTRVKNAVIRSDMSKIVLSVEGYRSSYDRIPNETDFFSALKPNTIQFEQSCEAFGDGDYECVFLPRAGMLPSACDLSAWRSEGETGQVCHMRYYAGQILNGKYRLYAKSWNEDASLFVYESGLGFHVCPAGFSDLYSIDSCEKL